MKDEFLESYKKNVIIKYIYFYFKWAYMIILLGKVIIFIFDDKFMVLISQDI